MYMWLYPWLHQNKMPEQPAQLKISPAVGHFELLQNRAPVEITEEKCITSIHPVIFIHKQAYKKLFATLFVGVFTINCSTLQLNRSLTASSQSLSSFSTCSIALSASLYRYNTQTPTEMSE